MSTRSPWPSTQASLLLQIRRLENNQAWETFVDIYGPLVYRFCRNRGLQDSEANDVTQNVFQRVTEGIRSFSYNRKRGRFRGWVGTIVRHEIWRFVEESRAVVKGTGKDQLHPALESLTSNDDGIWFDDYNNHVLQEAMRRIRPEFDDATWQAFKMNWVEDIKPVEVARKLEQKVAWVYKAKFKVVRRLKEEVLFLASDIALYLE